MCRGEMVTILIVNKISYLLLAFKKEKLVLRYSKKTSLVFKNLLSLINDFAELLERLQFLTVLVLHMIIYSM